jgi:hypothetical protein
MEEVERIFGELSDSIMARLGDKGHVNFLVVTGLAGGTGRGCWELLAFKFRELFMARNVPLTPIGYFYDASVFANVMNRYPDQKARMCVNSLTGISQLSAWLANIRNADGHEEIFPYRLPRLDAPSVTAINLQLELDAAMGTPVNNAVLVFGKSDATMLRVNDDYHEMIGTAIYARMVHSRIRDVAMNHHHPYLSIGAASFEVNAEDLRNFCEILAKRESCAKQLQSLDPAVDQRIDDWTGDVKIHHGLGAVGNSGLRADRNGNLLQRICHEIESEFSVELDSLKRELESDSVETAVSIATRLVEPSTQSIRSAVERVVHGLRDENRDILTATREECIEVVGELGSVGAVCQFISLAIERIEECERSLPPDIRAEDGADPNLNVDLVESIERAARSREHILFGRRFDETEISLIMESARRRILIGNFADLHDELQALYRDWTGTLKAWLRKARALKECIENVRVNFRRELPERAALFGSFERPEDAILDKDDPVRFSRRELKPLIRKGQESKLVEESIATLDLRDWVLARLFENDWESDRFDARTDAEKALEAICSQQIRLPEDFLETNFSINKILPDICESWCHRLTGIGSHDERIELVERFESFFGTTPTFRGNRYELPAAEEMLGHMARSLVASCRPFWTLKEGAQQAARSVTLFVPTRERNRLEDINDDQVNVDIHTLDDDREISVFHIIAVADAALGTIEDTVSSLDYWRGDPDVSEWLEACEDAEGKALFDDTWKERVAGFSQPIFVNQERLRNLRWKPWADYSQIRLRKSNDVQDALIYALWTPLPEMGGKLEIVGWKMPLIRAAARERYLLGRYFLQAKDGNFVDDRKVNRLTPDKQIGVSIRNMFKFFSGGLDEGGKVLCDRILEELALFKEEACVKAGVGPGTDDWRKSLETHLTSFADMRDSAKDSEDHSVWQALIERIEEWQED